MAALEAGSLIMHAAKCDRQSLIIRAKEIVPPLVLARTGEYLSRRLRGEPLAYILGEWDLCGVGLKITRDVLIPRTDTELLVFTAANSTAHIDNLRVLDLCCGSGCVGVAIAYLRQDAHITFCDVSSAALEVTRINAEKQGIPFTLIQHDMLAAPPPGRYDVLACNPPYIPTGELAELDVSVRDYEPMTALDGGDDGLDFYRALAGYADQLLMPDGVLLLEVGQGQAGTVAGLFAEKKIDVYNDTQGIERVLAVHMGS
jgi:release factor glutamine methyltransferase